MSDYMKNFIKNLLHPNPVLRLGAQGAQEVKEHIWFYGFDFEKL